MLDEVCGECGNTIKLDPEGRTHIAATDHVRTYVIPIGDIRFFRHAHKYVSAYYSGGELLLPHRADKRNPKLPANSIQALVDEYPSKFMRIHRNALINRDFLHGMEIRTINKSMNVYYWAIVDGHKVEVSRKYNALLRKACGN